MVRYERQADGSYMPTQVFLATPKRLQGKALAGDPRRDREMSGFLTSAMPPRINDYTEERGTFEDWIGWALNALSNGHTSWATEVPPLMTVDQLYQKYILDVQPKPLTRPDVVPSTVSTRLVPLDPLDGDDLSQVPGALASTTYWREASERDDDLLQRYLPAERPIGFDALSADERAIRGRYLLMTWAFTGNLPFAWAASSAPWPGELDEMRKVVGEVPDSRIEEELVRTAAERGEGNVTFASIGTPPSSLSREERQRRYVEMQRLHREGYTLKQVGERYGLTRERVRQILKQEPHRVGRPPNDRRPGSEPSSPFRQVTIADAATGEIETFLVRISQRGVTEWLRDREELRSVGKPDRPPDVDTETMRTWLPHPGEEDLPFFAGQRDLVRGRMGEEEFEAVFSVSWHERDGGPAAADLTLYAYTAGRYYLQVFDNETAEVIDWPAGTPEDEVDEATMTRAIAIDARGVWSPYDPFITTYADMRELQTEISLAEAEIARELFGKSRGDV